MGERADDSLIVHASRDSANGKEATRRLFRACPNITAIVCLNVIAAIGALRQIREMGQRVPEDVSVIAIHDLIFAPDLMVPLSVVAMPLNEMGGIAVKTVCTPPETAKTTISIDCKPRLILRASTTRPAGLR